LNYEQLFLYWIQDWPCEKWFQFVENNLGNCTNNFENDFFLGAIISFLYHAAQTDNVNTSVEGAFLCMCDVCVLGHAEGGGG